MGFKSFDKLINAHYTVSCTFNEPLMPQTVKKENFTVCGKNVNCEAKIDDIIYIPTQKTALLTLAPSSICDFSYAIELTDEVLKLNGEKLDESKQNSELKIGFDTGQEGISVINLAIYNGSNRIIKPVGKMSVVMEIELINATSEQQKGKLSVYQTGDEEKPLISSEVTLEAGKITKFVFHVAETEFFEEKGLNISLAERK